MAGIEKITEFAPTAATPCWSVYVERVSPISGGVFRKSHSYGTTRAEAISEARAKLRATEAGR